MAPLDVIDYLVIHELAHLTEKNHSRRFWNRVEAMLPDFRRYETWLKEHGRRLTLE
jgi:predicted metal-dependent hydrolase